MEREDRIRKYAYEWWQRRQACHDYTEDPVGDWAKAEHMVNAEEWAREKKFNQKSKAIC